MPGFGAYTHTYETRLNERPFWRKPGYCPQESPLGRFSAKADEDYRRNAVGIREARFSKSNVVSGDLAIRRKREAIVGEATTMQNAQDRSDYMYRMTGQRMANVDPHSLLSNTGLQLSGTGEALATGQRAVTVTNFIDPTLQRDAAPPAAPLVIIQLPQLVAAAEEAVANLVDTGTGTDPIPTGTSVQTVDAGTGTDPIPTGTSAQTVDAGTGTDTLPIAERTIVEEEDPAAFDAAVAAHRAALEANRAALEASSSVIKAQRNRLQDMQKEIARLENRYEEAETEQDEIIIIQELQTVEDELEDLLDDRADAGTQTDTIPTGTTVQTVDAGTGTEDPVADDIEESFGRVRGLLDQLGEVLDENREQYEEAQDTALDIQHEIDESSDDKEIEIKTLAQMQQKLLSEIKEMTATFTEHGAMGGEDVRLNMESPKNVEMHERPFFRQERLARWQGMAESGDAGAGSGAGAGTGTHCDRLEANAARSVLKGTASVRGGRGGTRQTRKRREGARDRTVDIEGLVNKFPGRRLGNLPPVGQKAANVIQMVNEPRRAQSRATPVNVRRSPAQPTPQQQGASNQPNATPVGNVAQRSSTLAEILRTGNNNKKRQTGARRSLF